MYRELSVPDDLRLLSRIAFGHEDSAHRANATRTVPEDVDSAIRFRA